MSWHEIAFGALCVFIGYGLGSYLTKTQMDADRFEEKEEEKEALHADRNKWIEYGRDMERKLNRPNGH